MGRCMIFFNLERSQRIAFAFGAALLCLVSGGWWLVQTFHTDHAPFWVTGYLPAYRHNGREIPFLVDADYRVLTHLAHASVIPRADGSLDIDSNSLHPDSQQAALQAANHHDLPLLLVVTGTYEQFMPALQAEVRPQFIANLLQLLDSGYDGIDIDMEPITRDETQGNPAFNAFIHELHTALQTRSNAQLHRTPLLTAAITLRDRYIMAQLAGYFDQINLMAYDMAQPHAGWISWYDSALYNGGLVFPGYSHQVPSVDLWVQRLLAAGIPSAKLGLGISLDVACWQGGEGTTTGGVTAPSQAWRSLPYYRKRSYAASYAPMQQAGFTPNAIHWDSTAQMAWFGHDAQDATQDFFCNFNDERAIQAKIAYAKQQGLGGIMIWELGLDQLDNLPATQRRPLRQAINQALEK